ncbi:aminotransferase [Roseovarius sp. EL26]|uniref:aminotransferase n=1 Tax=Roseovarius sp. EL26 TaxID=2126672 RepID=UPI000EA1C3C3|nr:aminotransferase [Roseovarius sp. EL26]
MATGRTTATFLPPVMEARRWLQGVDFPPNRPLINVSQAAPVDPPPEDLCKVIAEAAINQPEAHLYGPVLGLPELRTEVAKQWNVAYGGTLMPDNIAITSGCNQAFCATIASLCSDHDEVILPTPWYFNHKMWLDMSGITTVPLKTGTDLLPDPIAADALITDKTRAIVLVTPNNPGGVEYPSELVQAFYDLAQRRGIKLVIDETYRDFDARSGAPHNLFQDTDWDTTLIQLYSFSKAFRLTGHRVGAITAATALLSEIEKFLDTVTICPNQLGQIAAVWGMQNLSHWLAGERDEILDRRAAIHDNFHKLEAKGWQLLGCGAYFAYVQHPFAKPSDEVARDLVREAGVLMLPGTMFHPDNEPRASREFRVAFANVDRVQIGELFDRLAQLNWPLAPRVDSA